MTISAEEGRSITSVNFDYSGQYLAATGSDLRIYHKTNFDVVKVFGNHEDLVTDAKFGRDAAWIASTSLDRTLRLFRRKA